MDRGAWQATVHGVTKSQTQLKRLSTHMCTLHETPFPQFLCPPKHLLPSFMELSSLGCLFPLSQSCFPDALSGFTHAPFPLPSEKPCVYHKWWQVLSQCQTSNTWIYQMLTIPRLWAKDLHAWPGLPDGKWQRMMGILHGFAPAPP